MIIRYCWFVALATAGKYATNQAGLSGSPAAPRANLNPTELSARHGAGTLPHTNLKATKGVVVRRGCGLNHNEP